MVPKNLRECVSYSIPDVSVVSTLYRSAPHLKSFYERMVAELKRLSLNYEVIFVNDGSPDESLRIALEIQNADSAVKVVDLSRNFGHHKAIMEGLSRSRGMKIFLIDCDLEEPPESLSDFYARYCEGDCDVVYGVQPFRKGDWVERVTGEFFYSIFNRLSGATIPRNWTVARLMSRRYVAALLQFKEESLFIGGVMVLAGFRQEAIEVQKFNKGSTTYSLRKRFSTAFDAIISFSEAPLRFGFYGGVIISILSFLYAGFLVLQKLFFGISVDGWTSLSVSIWMVGGLLISFTGLVGIYVSRIFLQTKNRPQSIVREVFEKE